MDEPTRAKTMSPPLVNGLQAPVLSERLVKAKAQKRTISILSALCGSGLPSRLAHRSVHGVNLYFGIWVSSRKLRVFCAASCQNRRGLKLRQNGRWPIKASGRFFTRNEVASSGISAHQAAAAVCV
jgi:hypothetical protein